jgi:hypothetical protein
MKRTSAHVTSSVFFNMNEVFSVSFVTNTPVALNTNTAALPLGVGNVVVNNNGSMTAGDPTTGEKGAFYVAVQDFVRELTQRMGPSPARGKVLLILDGARAHNCFEALRLLRDNDVDVHMLMPNVTPLMQISDQPQLHGFQKKYLTQVMAMSKTLNQDIEWHRDLRVLTLAVKSVFTLDRIVQAVQSIGIKYVNNSAFSRIQMTDEDAREQIQRLADKGCFDHHIQSSMELGALRRLEEVRVLNKLVEEGVIDSGTRTLVTPGTLRVMRNRVASITSRRVEFVKEANKRRRRDDLGGALVVQTDLKPDHRIVNDETLMAARRAEVVAKVQAKENTKQRKAKVADLKQKRGMKESRKKVLIETLTNRGVTVTPQQLKSVSKYYTGNNPDKYTLDWAITKLTAPKRTPKAAVPPTTTAPNTAVPSSAPVHDTPIAPEPTTPRLTPDPTSEPAPRMDMMTLGARIRGRQRTKSRVAMEMEECS